MIVVFSIWCRDVVRNEVTSCVKDLPSPHYKAPWDASFLTFSTHIEGLMHVASSCASTQSAKNAVFKKQTIVPREKVFSFVQGAPDFEPMYQSLNAYFNTSDKVRPGRDLLKGYHGGALCLPSSLFFEFSSYLLFVPLNRLSHIQTLSCISCFSRSVWQCTKNCDLLFPTKTKTQDAELVLLDLWTKSPVMRPLHVVLSWMSRTVLMVKRMCTNRHCVDKYMQVSSSVL